MMNDKQWNNLMAEHEIAYLRGDLATSSPESYTIEEMKGISEGMDASTAEVEAAMREDFNSMLPEAQEQMLDLLAEADPGNMRFRLKALGFAMPDAPPADEAPGRAPKTDSRIAGCADMPLAERRSARQGRISIHWPSGSAMK